MKVLKLSQEATQSSGSHGMSWQSFRIGTLLGLGCVALCTGWLAGCDGGQGPGPSPQPVAWSTIIEDDESGAFYSVWGSGPSDVWIAGGEAGKPSLRHFDGKAWSRGDPPLAAKLRWVHGDGLGKVLVVGDGGQAALYDGKAWTTLTTGHPGAVLWGTWLQADGTGWAVGGAASAVGEDPGPDKLLLLRRQPGATSFEPVALGERTKWPKSSSSQLFKLWRDDATGKLFAVGGRAYVAASGDGAGWQESFSDSSGAPLFTVHGRSATDVWAVGGAIGAILVRFDGKGWQPEALPEDVPFVVQGVFVHPDGRIDVAGEHGFTARRATGGTWTSASILTAANLHAVFHDGKRTWTVGGDIAIDKTQHLGAIFCDDPTVPAITP